MKRTSISIWNLIGFVFTVITGSLLHFVNDWFSGAFWAVLGPVNESTWEHLKLIFVPMLVFMIVEYFFYGKHICGFVPIKISSILIGMLSIVVLFYTYSGVLGYFLMPVDIAIFVISAALAYWFAARQLIHQFPPVGEFSFAPKRPDDFWCRPASLIFALFLLLVLIACFVMFTFNSPDIGLFHAPSQTCRMVTPAVHIRRYYARLV